METWGNNNDELIISNWGIQEAAPTQDKVKTDFNRVSSQGNSEGGDRRIRLVGVPINCAIHRSSGVGLCSYKYST